MEAYVSPKPSSQRPGQPDERRTAWVLVGGLGLLFLVFVVILATASGDGGGGQAKAAPAKKLPVYYTIKPGDSYVRISEKTGLTIEQLETFNPYVNPSSLIAGQRLKLRAKVPPPPPKKKGPKYWRVKQGDTVSRITSKTGKTLPRILELNKGLKPDSLKVGQRIKLRE